MSHKLVNDKKNQDSYTTMGNSTTKRITNMQEHPCNKHDKLSAIKQENYRSTGTISLMDQ